MASNNSGCAGSAGEYRLRCTVRGHSKDVRALAATLLPDGGLVSGSRDTTVKIWAPDGVQAFKEVATLKGHSHFVSCVCIAPPSDSHPEGLILTGSNDGIIRAFTTRSPEPAFLLKGHENTVSALCGGKFGLVLSGSWDCTVRVWHDNSCVSSLEGHSAAVWAVAFLPQSSGVGETRFLSGAADKTIRLWVSDPTSVGTTTSRVTFKGHTDCVRGLAVLTANDFLSCSNDATIRHWLVDGDCLAVYEGHTNFIYSIAILPNGQDFVSCGEDRTLRVWRGGQCCQTVFLPATSVWCVSSLPDGDVAVGGSDGTVRVFTQSDARKASDAEVAEFEAEVSAVSISAQEELGGIKISELPGPSSLYEPGKREGQTKMVREADGQVNCYSWQSGKWNKVGQVVGASGATQNTSGKTLYDGIEYDYVFNIELEEGKAALKLPYNLSEDPWFAAQRFIHKHDLSQLFLDQIATFIVNNTKGMTLGVVQSQAKSSDPFTGGDRYVPGMPAAPRPSPEGMDADVGKEVTPKSSDSMVGQFFPQMEFLRFDQANPDAILSKLCEFNSRTGDGQHKMEDEALREVVKLTQMDQTPNQTHLVSLRKLLQWPHETVFPALDLLRLAVRVDQSADYFCTTSSAPPHAPNSMPYPPDDLGRFLLQFLTSNCSPANQMLALRTITNLFSTTSGFTLVHKNADQLLSAVLEMAPYKNKNVQVAAGTVLLNMCVLCIQDASWTLQCLSVASSALEHMTDGEACFRTLVGLGTLLEVSSVGPGQGQQALELAHSLNLQPRLQQLRLNSDLLKVKQCAAQLIALLK